MEVLILAPEPPYPLQGGGAFRMASLVQYFARMANVHLILFSESGEPALLPEGLVDTQSVIRLPEHRRDGFARYARNASRAVRGIPPLIDRLSGLEREVEKAIDGRKYELGIAEHFWCAPYIDQLEGACRTTVLDLHNIESVLHDRSASCSRFLVQAGHRRFAAASRKLEARYFPLYSHLLTTSENDAATAKAISPGSRVSVYPNSLPWVERPSAPEQPRLVFSGNFEYHPNIDAVQFLVEDIWPEVRRRHPELTLRLVGRGDSFIRHLLPSGQGIETTGQVEDAMSEIAQARLVLAPLRAGSGTRIKILEAWAAARPVIATPVAAEGLEARSGPGPQASNLELAATATEFIQAIERLLADPCTRRRYGDNGRRTFEARYSWESAWASLDSDLQVI